jgi:hypothetical protein
MCPTFSSYLILSLKKVIYRWKKFANFKTLIVCLFVFESHKQFFSYLVTVTITGDRADRGINEDRNDKQS